MLVLKDYPDHHDAELVIKLYDLRREPLMRESRNAINRDFWPKSAEEMLAVTSYDHPLNAAFRQVSTYWEMVYAMAKHGVIHADFMLESCGEGLLLFARVEPWLAAYREKASPLGFRNAEWVASHCDMGKTLMDRFRRRVQVATQGAAKPSEGR